MAKEKILIVDDEQEISHLLDRYLTREMFQVIVTSSGKKAIQLVDTEKPDLIILDILLPDINGIEVCQQIRSKSTVPIVFISCKDDASDKVLGLELGGDDYIVKPFSPSEVVARVKAHLRRHRYLTNNPDNKQVLKFHGIEIDASSYTVRTNGKTVCLSAKEFQILNILAQHPNQIFTASQLFDYVWQEDASGDLRTVVVHISNLRKKIEPDSSRPKYIQTVRNVGYRFTI
ncbi:response regulator transcription factor [Metallumcola ferriviriculae]|uniref:Stage 0 sporulation protein A homolog n=1 Tax=Metallumcola ferriviriculae TaxID=3039180 RepID=A0AAU0UK60_9FIRM|nr:response regulator transcription factor [Desulfitibacteraceae bacterium MK1]